jgi:ribosome-associated protein
MSQENQPTQGPGGVEIAPNVHVPEAALRFSYARSSGPGGQNVNKLSTKVRLEVSFDALIEALGEKNFRHLLEAAGPSHIVEAQQVLVVTCDSSRSQISNRQSCMSMLRQWVLEAKKPRKNRRPTKPTRGSQRRRVDAKKQRGQRKAERRGPDAHD